MCAGRMRSSITSRWRPCSVLGPAGHTWWLAPPWCEAESGGMDVHDPDIYLSGCGYLIR